MTWEDITMNVSPFLLLPPGLNTDHYTLWHGTSLCHLVPLLPTLCCPTPHWWGGMRHGKGLDSAQELLFGNTISLCYQHCFQHKSKSQPHTIYLEGNYLCCRQNYHIWLLFNLPLHMTEVLLNLSNY